MELKYFISETLSQIIDGVNQVTSFIIKIMEDKYPFVEIRDSSY